MADKLDRTKAFLAKIETTEGTDAVPTGAANAILIRREARVTPLAGAGAAGTAPAYGPLLRACATAETINAGVDVQYDPVSGTTETVTGYFYKGNTLHALLGARGDATLMFPPNAQPYYRFRFIGLLVAPQEQSIPALTLTAFVAAVPVNKANTATFTLHGYAAVLENLELTIGNVVEHRDRPGEKRVLRTDRAGSGTVRIKSPELSAKDYFAAITAHTQAALQIVHGTAAGNIIQVDCPKVQITEPDYGESQGLETLQMAMTIIPDTGDDEIKVTVK